MKKMNIFFHLYKFMIDVINFLFINYNKGYNVKFEINIITKRSPLMKNF